MEDYEFLIGLISNTGFPIVAFLLVFWKFDKSLGLLTVAVNNNTKKANLNITVRGLANISEILYAKQF